jgi:hypothetical protein
MKLFSHERRLSKKNEVMKKYLNNKHLHCVQEEGVATLSPAADPDVQLHVRRDCRGWVVLKEP